MERKKAIVTGASRGIGRGIARVLAREGYDLAISYSTKQAEGEAVAESLKKEYGGECFCFQASLEQPGAGVELLEKSVEALGGLDLLVNNAGVTRFENILDMTPEVFELLFRLDFQNYILMMQAAARHMVKHRVHGSLVNITSTRGERAYAGDFLYGGLKAGLNRAIQSIALDLAPYGIRVNNVAPGATRIRTKEELEAEGRPDFWSVLGEKIPLGRCGTPEDIGEAVAFLASEKASYITGMTVKVDGGLILPGMPEHVPAGEDPGCWGRAASKYAESVLNSDE
ncbi:SDR family oxidoreductase [Acutalibacter sp. 1XD8-33]|uniref:SDR family NAD(P)-dependent oxidoreductase n=1 Tax=Acutalibacter sp. 1XD8-33 TaxID=2320081 RepID=UPI000EA2A3F4|nr:SDR family NAD(P)-dependent oxidoreductase [Acutalibacter sp. 1XD8-33]RKJ39430.1 SDR family oxidoreductase [Acutalibacter sp. 1XD8-33]